MQLKTTLRALGASALVGALALTALPSAALAQGRQLEGMEANASGGAEPRAGEARERAFGQRAERQAERAERRVERAARQSPPQQAQAAAPVQRAGRDWNRGDRRSDAGERAGRDWNRRDNSSNDWGQARAAQVRAQAEARRAARAQAQVQSQGQLGDRSQRWDGRRQGGISGSSNTGANTGGWERNRSYGDRDRNRTYRDGYRDGRQRDEWRDNRQQQNAYRDGYRAGDRSDDGRRWDGNRDGRSYSGNHRRWSNDWRRDNRYNWYSYRNSNRNLYRIGRYYSPYSNYRYSRLSIGFRLGSLFYGSRYWINDPWQYRLPEAYGPYRWVRYYDDALLVDIYTGEVVDVIYDFFW